LETLPVLSARAGLAAGHVSFGPMVNNRREASTYISLDEDIGFEFESSRSKLRE
jgi:hypothetical protein